MLQIDCGMIYTLKHKSSHGRHDIDGLAQDCSISSALAMDLVTVVLRWAINIYPNMADIYYISTT